MNFDFKNSLVGYDESNTKDLLTKIKQVVDDTNTNISASMNEVIDGIDYYWVGMGAEAFKEVQREDIKELSNAFSEISQGIQNNILIMGQDVVNSDNVIAASINGLIDTNTSGYTGNNSVNQSISASVNGGIPSNILDSIDNVLERTGATIATAGTYAGKGLMSFGEDVMDAGVIIGAAALTPTALLTDGAGYIASKLTGADYEPATKAMWSAAKGFTSKTLTEDLFNSMEDTSYGKWLQNNAYGYDTVKNVSTSAGYMAGTVGATILTGGLAGGILGLTPAATGALLTGATSLGRNTTAAWRDGASTTGGLAYGSVMGAKDAAMGYVALPTIGTGVSVANSALNAVARTGLNAAQSALDVPLESAAHLLYDPSKEKQNELLNLTNFDEDGNQINNKTWEDLTISDKAKLYFDEAGGTKQMITSVATSALVSGGMEAANSLVSAKQNLDSDNISTKESTVDLEDTLEMEPVKESTVDLEDTLEMEPVKESTVDLEDTLEMNPVKESTVDLDDTLEMEPIDLNKNDSNSTLNNKNNNENIVTIKETKDTTFDGNAKSFKDVQRFLQPRSEAITAMSKHFGDAGEKVNDLFRKGMTAEEIMNVLPDNEKGQFKEYLTNTHAGQWLSGLSKDQIKSINYYSSISCDGIQNELRAATTDADIVINRDKVKNIDSALEQFGGTREDAVLYRGVNLNSFAAQEGYGELFNGVNANDPVEIYATLSTLTGKTFHDKAYMSASPGLNTCFKNRKIILEIDTPKGSKGAYINQISDFYNSENEFLLPRDTSLKMAGVALKKIGNDEKVVVHCKYE